MTLGTEMTVRLVGSEELKDLIDALYGAACGQKVFDVTYDEETGFDMIATQGTLEAYDERAIAKLERGEKCQVGLGALLIHLANQGKIAHGTYLISF